jgi:hypothetical protein
MEKLHRGVNGGLVKHYSRSNSAKSEEVGFLFPITRESLHFLKLVCNADAKVMREVQPNLPKTTSKYLPRAIALDQVP